MNKEISKYYREKYDIENESKNTTYYITSQMIENNSHILEIGCATGHFSLHLIEDKNCKLFAIDISDQQIKIAQERGINAVLANVEESEFDQLLRNYTDNNDKFDYIIINDVIEHLRYPEHLLQKLKCFIKNDGYLIISVPNIAFWQIRLGLLFGNFDYTEVGILDNTHLKFFTIKTFKELLATSGYQIEELKNIHSRWLYYFLMHTKNIFLFKKCVHPLMKTIFDGIYTFQIVAKVKKSN